MHRSPAQMNLFPTLQRRDSWDSESSLRRFDLGSCSSSSSSEFGEHLSLFHKFKFQEHLKRSPIEGLYEQITHSGPDCPLNGGTRGRLVKQCSVEEEKVEVIRETDPEFPISSQPIEEQFVALPSISSLQVPHQRTTTPSPNQVGNSMPSRPTQQNMHYPGETVILEQPASKALRFRYECEGRSAGSIPGVHSTPENKTYPTIHIKGYKGKAVVVVSCVTKDAPYRPHPHNLVGKEGCKRGVCTLEISDRNEMTVSFSNLGIQCVKKRDIEDALKQRQEIRVDPFRTGFDHKSQPSSVDLNVVRLCFQVFLEGEKGKFTRPLAPVVSEPIFDKKAMSDLVICKLSDCTSSVLGNREIILLCEKVAKEDIAVRFYEEQNRQPVWEAFGEFQHSAVHKQVAIAFKTPPYRTTQITENVKVFIQLIRPSDGICSDPLPFEYTPIDTGRPRFKSLRDDLKRMANIDIFEQILVNNNSEAGAHLDNSNDVANHEDENNNQFLDFNETSPVSDTSVHEKQETIEILDTPLNETPSQQFLEDDDKTLNDLLEQVAELDEIYTDHQMRRDELDSPKNFNSFTKTEIEKMDVDFDDAATYSSLQKAFKNPIDITIGPPVPQRPLHGQLIPEHDEQPVHTYDAVDPLPSMMTINSRNAPKIDVQPMLKRENHEDEKLPPLPPKRARKLPEADLLVQSDKENFESFPPLTASQSQILIKNADPPNKKLPPTPTKNGNSATLPRQKKPGFFSKLFSRKKSKSDVNTQTPSVTAKTTPAASREPSVAAFDLNDPNRGSFRSLKNPIIEDLKEGKSPSKAKVGKPVGRSVSSVSGKRPHLGPEIIHIPLKGDSTNSLPQSNPNLHRHGTPQHSGYGSASTISLHALDKDRKTMSALQLADLPLKDGNMELVAIADAQSIKNLCEGDFGVQLDPDVNLSEAEHYALYTSIPPFATMSEIDENSMYYAPVEGGEILTPSEVAKRLTTMNHALSDTLRRKRQKVNSDVFAQVLDQIPPDERKVFRNISPAGPPSVKAEPRDQTPSPYGHQQTTPIQMFGGQMYDYRNNLVAGSPSPQPPQQQMYNVSPQPQFTLPSTSSAFGTNNPFLQPDNFQPNIMFPEGQLAPLTGHFISPVPMEMSSTQQIPPPSMHLQILSNTQNALHQDSIGAIDPIEDFQINSSEIRNLLNDGDFSSLNSGQQSGMRLPPLGGDRDNDQCLSDSLDKQCRF